MIQKLKKQASRTDKEYETLGRMLESFYESGYINHKKLIKLVLLKEFLLDLAR